MNPILQMLQNPAQTNVLSKISEIQRFLSGKDLNLIYEKWYSENPQFKEFVDQNRDKTPQQILSERGINIK